MPAARVTLAPTRQTLVGIPTHSSILQRSALCSSTGLSSRPPSYQGARHGGDHFGGRLRHVRGGGGVSKPGATSSSSEWAAAASARTLVHSPIDIKSMKLMTPTAMSSGSIHAFAPVGGSGRVVTEAGRSGDDVTPTCWIGSAGKVNHDGDADHGTLGR